MTVMASIAVETRQPVPKKRKVSKDPTDMDDGKKRGRPRVEKNDESAADVSRQHTLLTDADTSIAQTDTDSHGPASLSPAQGIDIG